MKAVVLAGGKGTRGRPYTDLFPKAMIPVHDRPVIGHVIDFLTDSKEIDEIIVLADLNGLGGQIRNYLQNSQGEKKISFVQDSQSGTGGDLVHLLPSLKDESEFLLWFADNLCRIDIARMKRHFLDKNSLACIATRSKRREETGFASVNNGMITEFLEKPEIDLPMPECLGVYILSTKILYEIREKSKLTGGKTSLSFDILEDQSRDGKVSAFDIGTSSWIGVESPAVLERNASLVEKIIKQMGR